MTILILGVALWWAAHLFKRLAPEARGRMGDPGKGLMAVAVVASVVLMVIVIALTVIQFRFVEKKVNY